MSKKTQKVSNIGHLIERIEGILDNEIDSLPDILQGITPEKRVDFISKTLPVILKYRESHSRGWEVPDWE